MSTASQKTTPPPSSDPAIAARQRRLRLLARAERGRLEQAFAALPQPPGYRRLKQPETGLAMLRARAGGVGQRFNMGEMTISRCVVALEASGAMGVGYVPGRDQRKAELVALFDALSQDAATAVALEASLFAPLESELAQAQAARAAKVAATKVDFFTMVRGED